MELTEEILDRADRVANDVRRAGDGKYPAVIDPDLLLALVAAARERDALRAAVERLRYAVNLALSVSRGGYAENAAIAALEAALEESDG